MTASLEGITAERAGCAPVPPAGAACQHSAASKPLLDTPLPAPGSTAALTADGSGACGLTQAASGPIKCPGVPPPAEHLARATSGADPSPPEPQLAPAAAAAAVAASAAAPAASAANAAAPQPALAAPTSAPHCTGSAVAPAAVLAEASERPDAAAAAAEAEAALGAAADCASKPLVAAAGWAHGPHQQGTGLLPLATEKQSATFPQNQDHNSQAPQAHVQLERSSGVRLQLAAPQVPSTCVSHPQEQEQQQSQPAAAQWGQPQAAAAATSVFIKPERDLLAVAGSNRTSSQWHRTPVQEADPDADYVLAGLPYAQDGERRHHLLKHELPDAARGSNALRFFGVDNVRQAVRRINKMAQRELQEMFQHVYGVRSSSNNNLWLRKKLVEAVNTRPRESGIERQPRGVAAAPAAASASDAAGAAASAPPAGNTDGSVRRRRKKSSAPMRASDGLQADPENAADALLNLLAWTEGGPTASEDGYGSESVGSGGRQAAAAAQRLQQGAGSPAVKRAKLDVAGARPRPQRSAAVSAVAAAAKAVLLDTPMEIDTAPGYSTANGRSGAASRARRARGARNGASAGRSGRGATRNGEVAAALLPKQVERERGGGYGLPPLQPQQHHQQYGGMFGEQPGWGTQASYGPPAGQAAPPHPAWQQAPPQHPAGIPGIPAGGSELSQSQAQLLRMLLQQQHPGNGTASPALGAASGASAGFGGSSASGPGFGLGHPGTASGAGPAAASATASGSGDGVLSDLLSLLLQRQQGASATGAAAAAPPPVDPSAAVLLRVLPPEVAAAALATLQAQQVQAASAAQQSRAGAGPDLLTLLLQRQQAARAPAAPAQAPAPAPEDAANGLQALLQSGRLQQAVAAAGAGGLGRLLQHPQLACLQRHFAELRQQLEQGEQQLSTAAAAAAAPKQEQEEEKCEEGEEGGEQPQVEGQSLLQPSQHLQDGVNGGAADATQQRQQPVCKEAGEMAAVPAGIAGVKKELAQEPDEGEKEEEAAVTEAGAGKEPAAAARKEEVPAQTLKPERNAPQNDSLLLGLQALLESNPHLAHLRQHPLLQQSTTAAAPPAAPPQAQVGRQSVYGAAGAATVPGNLNLALLAGLLQQQQQRRVAEAAAATVQDQQQRRQGDAAAAAGSASEFVAQLLQRAADSGVMGA